MSTYAYGHPVGQDRFEIQRQLREAYNYVTSRPISTGSSPQSSPNRGLEVVIADRASGKTSGLVRFVGERTLVLEPDKRIGVIVPTEDIGRDFLLKFQALFPGLTAPNVVTQRHLFHLTKVVTEVYIEEVYLFNRDALREIYTHYPVIAGVGTIVRPTTITIHP